MTHFLPILRTSDTSFSLRVTEDLCVGPLGHVFLFGGAGLGAAVLALEQTFQRGLVWATAQYISFARLGADVVLDVAVRRRDDSYVGIAHHRAADGPVFEILQKS